MSLTLHLGVINIPYAKAPKANQRKAGSGGTQTTGDVAQWIENKYGVMEKFWEANKETFAKSLENSLAGALESTLMGRSNSGDPFGTVVSDIEHEFKAFIAEGRIEQLGVGGVPTQAALDGINHRKKNPRTGARRPSFIDTGLYQASFKAWVDGNEGGAS